MKRWRGQRGSVSIELAILTPGLLLVASLAWVVGRMEFAAAAVDHAAYTSARTASLARDDATAQLWATTSAQSTLARQELHCTSPPSITVDTSGFDEPVGEPAIVTVTISCVVDFADIALPGMPTSQLVASTYSSPLDQYRSRAG